MILSTVKVEDFDRFWNTFSTKGAEKRKEHGSQGARVFRDPNDDSRVWVVFDMDQEAYGRRCPTPTCRRSSRMRDSRAGRRRQSLPARPSPSSNREAEGALQPSSWEGERPMWS